MKKTIALRLLVSPSFWVRHLPQFRQALLKGFKAGWSKGHKDAGIE